MLTTNTPPAPKLLGINHDGPVRMVQLGTKDPIIWTVQPENFDKLVEFINRSRIDYRLERL